MEPGHWPNWIYGGKLLFTFALTAGLGIHAYNAHVRESADDVSRRRWMYWLYAAVFLLATMSNFLQLCIATATGSCERSSSHLTYASIILVLSYVALMVGVSRRP